MNVSAINGTEAVNNSVVMPKKPEVKEEAKAVNTQGYAEKEPAPTNANLYKAMYGVEEKKEEKKDDLAEYKAAMTEHLKNWGTDEQLKQVQEPEQTKEEEEYYKQYLAYKHKYD